jgi:hypothetical protein
MVQHNYFEIDHWMSEDTPQVVDRMVSKGIRDGNTKVASAVKGNKRPGFSPRRSQVG